MAIRRAWWLYATSGSLRIVIPVTILLIAFTGWSMRQMRLQNERRAQVEARTRAEAEAKEMQQRLEATAARATKSAQVDDSTRRARQARTDTRVQELYDEINQLTELSERVVLPVAKAPSTSRAGDGQSVRVR